MQKWFFEWRSIFRLDICCGILLVHFKALSQTFNFRALWQFILYTHKLKRSIFLMTTRSLMMKRSWLFFIFTLTVIAISYHFIIIFLIRAHWGGFLPISISWKFVRENFFMLLSYIEVLFFFFFDNFNNIWRLLLFTKTKRKLFIRFDQMFF
jgi:hypothetical protein